MKTLALIVFSVGVAGYVVLPYTLLTNFVALEYIFLGAGTVGVSHSLQMDDFDGQFFLLCVLAVAAAEAALGLALLVQFYRLRGNVQTLVLPLVKAITLVSVEVPLEFLAAGLLTGVLFFGLFNSSSTGGGGGGGIYPDDEDWWKQVLFHLPLVILGVVLWSAMAYYQVGPFEGPVAKSIPHVVDELFRATLQNPAWVDQICSHYFVDPQEQETARQVILSNSGTWKRQVLERATAWVQSQPRTATPQGLDWICQNTLVDLLEKTFQKK